MRRLILPASLFVNCALAVWLLSHERPPRTRPLTPGETIIVVRPTGEFVTGANGSGDPQEKTERIALRVVKRQGEPTPCPPGRTPWYLTAGGVTSVASAVDD